jgi:hypothetical protein
VRFRLPANSILSVKVDRDEIVIRETLQGRSGAVRAIVFACFTIFAMVAASAFPKGYRKMEPVVLIIVIGMVLSELTVMLLVIHQTWRTTLLTVRFEEMLLAFSSPLHRKNYRWTGSDIADILLIETANNQTRQALAELCITRSLGGEIHLFTDHPAKEIQSLLAVLPAMLREGRSIPLEPVAVVPAPDSPPIDPGTGAMETSVSWWSCTVRCASAGNSDETPSEENANVQRPTSNVEVRACKSAIPKLRRWKLDVRIFLL